jgi:hypothetical protein
LSKCSVEKYKIQFNRIYTDFEIICIEPEKYLVRDARTGPT